MSTSSASMSDSPSSVANWSPSSVAGVHRSRTAPLKVGAPRFKAGFRGGRSVPPRHQDHPWHVYIDPAGMFYWMFLPVHTDDLRSRKTLPNNSHPTHVPESIRRPRSMPVRSGRMGALRPESLPSNPKYIAHTTAHGPTHGVYMPPHRRSQPVRPSTACLDSTSPATTLPTNSCRSAPQKVILDVVTRSPKTQRSRALVLLSSRAKSRSMALQRSASTSPVHDWSAAVLQPIDGLGKPAGYHFEDESEDDSDSDVESDSRISDWLGGLEWFGGCD